MHMARQIPKPLVHLDILFCQIVVNDPRVGLTASLKGETVLRRRLFEGQLFFIFRPTSQTLMSLKSSLVYHRTAVLPALTHPPT